MSSKSVLIIGGGMAGLAAGCYARMNGFDTIIFEAHDLPGGLCTAWTRRGYTFDVSLHFITNSRWGGLFPIWQELGALHGRTLVDHENGGVIEDEQGRRSVAYSDLDKMEAAMLALSPRDEQPIRELVGLARQLGALDMEVTKAQELWSIADTVKYLARNWRMLNVFRKWGKVSAQAWAQRIQDPLLRRALAWDAPGWPMPDVPLPVVAMVLGMGQTNNMSYAVGGSVGVAHGVAARYADLGGRIVYNARVKEILVETVGEGKQRTDRAVGVRLADGSEQRADYVISAGDGRTAIWGMLGARYMDAKIARFYREWQVYPPLVMVMLGVARDFSAEPHVLEYPLAQPVTVAGRERTRLELHHYCFDPTMAPPGKSVLQAWYTTDWEYWERLSGDRAAYRAAKEAVAAATIGALEQRWPGIGRDVEVVDVPTPLTFRRYTGNHRGSPDGWCITTRNFSQSMPRTLPGLAGFYMAGQWTLPFSGVPGAVMSGRAAVELICAAEKQRFVTSTPPAGWAPPPFTLREEAPNAGSVPEREAASAAPAVSANGALHATLDAGLCTGCGDCASVAPAVFAVASDGVARVLLDPVPPEYAAAARAAAEACAEGAIQLS
jgi:phytoene dehydrogenase-like protein/ferredoxin